MKSINFLSANEIRVQFTRAMSEMYQLEVPLYKKLLSLANNVNQDTISSSSPLTANESRLLQLEHHGAIRVGSASELFMLRRLFKVMGMHPVDYYDLSVAGIPVHSTAFRALNKDDLELSPFRVFCSLLRLDLIEDDQLREQANEILNKRQIFPEELLKLIESSKKQGGLTVDEANSFIENALEVFRWHQNSTVSKQTYDELKVAHGLIADIVSFKGPHINHLTPKILDIDACQAQFSKNEISAKTIVEGPPKRNCPILLRQTSFLAIAENVIFSDDKNGTHTARFGEVEQRGVALTPKGRKLYDRLLLQARNANTDIAYEIRLSEAFKEFPDTYEEMRIQGLAYFYYNANAESKQLNYQSNDIESLVTDGYIDTSPMVYEDFLPVSAAGIFASNLLPESNNSQRKLSEKSKTESLKIIPLHKVSTSRDHFEEALGAKLESSFDLYEKAQKKSLNTALKVLGIKTESIG